MSYSIESFHFFYYYRYFLFHFIIIEKTNWKIHLEKPILFIENKYEYLGGIRDVYKRQVLQSEAASEAGAGSS